MKLSRKKVIYGGILALAVAGLVVDRAFLRPGHTAPRSTEAAESDGQTEGTTASAAPSNTQAQPLQVSDASEAKGSAAELLADLSRKEGRAGIDLAGMRNAYRPSESWLGELQSAPPAATKTDELAKTFLQQHRLRAVIVEGQARKVIVNESCLEVGAEIDGFTLAAIEDDSAVFACGQRRVTLKMAEDPESAGKAKD